MQIHGSDVVDKAKCKKAILSTHHAVFQLHEIESCSKKLACNEIGLSQSACAQQWKYI